MVGPGKGIELVSNVNNIPKGSRLAVSTNLLAALISVCMRATGQASSLTGPLQESERRLVLARALLGEWLGGSGGGWQDSGGVWPGMKLIEGVLAAEGDPKSASAAAGSCRNTASSIQTSLRRNPATSGQSRARAWRHGPKRRPILEMVTKNTLYPLPNGPPGHPPAFLRDYLRSNEASRTIGAATTRNFEQPIQTIIPWATNYFTETLIQRVSQEFGQNFWGFWMLGGMSGGGMGFIFAPESKSAGQTRLQEIMSQTKRELEHALPFAMEPVVYDFAINERGTFADLLQDHAALMPPGYYTLTVPALLRQDRQSLSRLRRAELDKFSAACRTRPELRGVVQTLFDTMLPRGKAESQDDQSLAKLLKEHGFDPVQHEQIRLDLKEGRIGLAQNRLPANAAIENVHSEDVSQFDPATESRALGLRAIQQGEIAVVTLAAGAGSLDPGRRCQKPCILSFFSLAATDLPRDHSPKAAAFRVRPVRSSLTFSPPAI
jgi:hypothetical protein